MSEAFALGCVLALALVVLSGLVTILVRAVRGAVTAHRLSVQAAPGAHSVLLATRLAAVGAVVVAIWNAAAVMTLGGATWVLLPGTPWLGAWVVPAFYVLLVGGLALVFLGAQRVFAALAKAPARAPTGLLWCAIGIALGPLAATALCTAELAQRGRLARSAGLAAVVLTFAVDVAGLLGVGAALALGRRTLRALPPLPVLRSPDGPATESSTIDPAPVPPIR